MNSHVDTTVKILVGAELSTNRLAALESVERPYSEPPCHRHHWEDELLYVISGEIAVLLEGQWRAAPAGTAIFIPRGAEHTFAVVGDEARLLTLFVPGGFEELYRELENTTPWGRGKGIDVERWIATAARYGCEITGPHPGRPRDK